MDELVQWLRAQLDDDERAARAWLPLGNPTATDREHIARHDPARVLREVEAKRRIVESCEAMEPDMTFVESYLGIPPGDHTEFAALTLALLALPYSDRPGYREEWRP